MRRIALYSDIHGNVSALEAVLADIESSGVAEAYCLGDLVGYGPRPAEVIARVREASHPTIRGNYDDGIGNRRGECGCYYSSEQARSDGAASYAFTDAALGDDERDYLAALPGDIRLEIDGARVLLCHGSPRKINEYLLPDRTDAHLLKLAEQAEVDVVCVGHVHVPYHRAMVAADERVVHFVSDGSVGKPKDGDPRACWVELVFATQAEVESAVPGDISAGQAGAGGVWVGARFHRARYNVDVVAAEMLSAGLPPTLAEALRRA